MNKRKLIQKSIGRQKPLEKSGGFSIFKRKVAIPLQDDHVCIQEGRIRSLEDDRTETKVYVKIIREDLGEIKAAVKSRAAPEFWQTVITKLLEIVATAFIILAGIWGLAKFIKP